MSWENWATHAWKLCAKMQTRFQKLRKNIKSNSRDISWQIGRQSTQENFMSPCSMLLGRKMFPIFKSKMILNECKIHEIWFNHQGSGEKESILKSCSPWFYPTEKQTIILLWNHLYYKHSLDLHNFNTIISTWGIWYIANICNSS